MPGMILLPSGRRSDLLRDRSHCACSRHPGNEQVFEPDEAACWGAAQRVRHTSPRPMNAAHWLARAARADPAKVAIHLGNTPWRRYGELAARAAALAAALRERLAQQAGDRVAVVMTNVPEYLEVLYATWWAGLAAVPVNAKLHPREVRFILEDSQAKAVFVSPDWRAGIDEAAATLAPAPRVIETRTAEYERLFDARPAAIREADAGALAWLFYTSGTTGRPKGAMLTHRNLAQMTLAYFADVDAVDARGLLLHAAPMSHGSGLYNFTHLAKGAGQVVPESGGFDPEEILRLLERHARVSFFAAPTMVKRLTEAAAAKAAPAMGLQTIVYGGGPMYLADIRRAMEVLGERFAQIYGQGESPMTISALAKSHHADRGHPRHVERLSSVGLPHSVVEISIRASSGDKLPPGEIGEVCVRGDVVMAGYWGNPAATAEALRDGWLWTGDVGVVDDEGFLTLKDRSKDLIVTGGANVYPREVEEVLLLHPGVAEAAVVGRPDAEWGEAVVAFVVPRGPPPEVQSLERTCLENMARFKRPKEYRFVERLPKNNYGKVVKTELRAMLSAGALETLR
jgi:long-chain acyl-CoA synthetase